MDAQQSLAQRLGRLLEKVTRQSGRLPSTPAYGSWLLGIAVIFVDIIGSTHLIATRPAVEVVDLLNRFFAVDEALSAARTLAARAAR
jgi:class 3 adenylate cyclase